MNNEVTTMGMSNQLVVTEDQLDLIKSTVAVGATNDELKLYLYDCKRHGVHPLDRMILFVKRGSGNDAKATHQCSIDFFRSEAEASGEYDGQDEPEFEFEDGAEYPSLARVKIYRKGIDRPFVGIARWAEFCPTGKQDFMWRKMPHGQLAKCAEAQGFRKAFPKKFAKLYSDDEMHQADYVDITSTTKTETVKPAGNSTASKPAATSSTAKIKPQEELKTLLFYYCHGDEDAALELLKELSIFGDPGKETWIKDLGGGTEKWAGKTLSKLKGKIKKEQGLPEGCIFNPEGCNHASVEDGLSYCGDKPCPFQKEQKF
ncbi:recombinase RecT [Candidatus Pacearchaeota archaeon]|nr:recombinase RecT [Candidatus Pacearchaeota archaeon]